MVVLWWFYGSWTGLFGGWLGFFGGWFGFVDALMGFDVGLMKFDRFDGALVRFLWWFNEISGELPYVKLTQL